MKITKKLNNNVALAVDGAGKELVVFGTGIGFRDVPYILTDLSKIQRTFYDVKAGYVELAGNLPEDMILLAADIVELAQYELDCELNPNLPFTLADHLNFALERFKGGLEVSTPLAYDAAHFYPREVALGRRALELIQERKGVALPACEAVNIALHLVNGELEHSDMHATLAATRVIQDITQIIEQDLRLKPDTESFNYSRFVMHIRYLLQRLEQDDQEVSGMSGALRHLALEHPSVYSCALKVRDYLSAHCGRQCNQDELLYLFMHINRLKHRGEEGRQ